MTNDEDEEQICISKEQYDSLRERDEWLYCLESAGIDNWCGWEEASRIKKELDGEEGEDE